MRRLLFFSIIVLAIILRIFKLGQNPASLYWDEVSLGYNAFTISASLRDEHGEFLPLDRFIAFGDYKPPGYIYATVPSILFFGLNEFAVRFPSMLAGLLLVVITYYLAKEFFGRDKIALLASFFVAVSPWALQFSRAGFEANLAVLFNLLGIYFFIIFRRKKFAIIISVIFFLLSFYTFNANRIIAPLMLIGLSILQRNILLENKKWVLVSLILGFVFLLPSLGFLQNRESKLRFEEVSIFNNLAPVETANERIAMDGNSWWAKLLHNRRLLFASDFLKHYFDNFSGRFLFTHGDVNPRLNIQGMGQLLIFELPLLLAGLYLLIKKKEPAAKILFLWMLIVPIPAATARETPHALRILSILPTFQIIIAYGLYQLVLNIKRFLNSSSVLITYCFMLFLSTLLSGNIYYYLHNYYIHYPRDFSGEWQYGYKDMVNYVSAVENAYDQVYVTNALGRPYIFFAFYQKLSLPDFLSKRVAERDWFGFWEVKALGKLKFDLKDLPSAAGRILLVTQRNNFPGDFRLLKTVRNLSGEEVFLIGERI